MRLHLAGNSAAGKHRTYRNHFSRRAIYFWVTFPPPLGDNCRVSDLQRAVFWFRLQAQPKVSRQSEREFPPRETGLVEPNYPRLTATKIGLDSAWLTPPNIWAESPPRPISQITKYLNSGSFLVILGHSWVIHWFHSFVIVLFGVKLRRFAVELLIQPNPQPRSQCL